MSFPRKAAAVTAALALMAPAGAAQAAHNSGKAGAPGQVCKSLAKKEKKAVLKQARADRKVTKAERKTAAKAFRAAYKECIQTAAKARGHEEEQEQEQQEQPAESNQSA